MQQPSHEEATAFWENEIQPHVSQLMTGKYSLRPVQERYTLNANRIVQRYSQSYLVQPYNTAIQLAGKQVEYNPIACKIENGKPLVAVFIQAFMAGMNKLRSLTQDPHLINATFEAVVVIGMMHEMEHLANGWIGADLDYEKMIEFERLAHGETCEHTLEHFATTRKPVLESQVKLYQKWVACGRSADHPEWIAEIRRMYRQA
ncbi:hypothetical protein KW782_01325 [Candidatus Parcubacteria bacterium]|nr:hypothetical protein [Candidatus Parcubacteria bacterium]